MMAQAPWSDELHVSPDQTSLVSHIQKVQVLHHSLCCKAVQGYGDLSVYNAQAGCCLHP